MSLFNKTPLAWKNLTHDWRRLSVSVAGIAFAVLLMFMQVGFQNALFDSQVKVIDDLQGDIFLTSKAKFTLASEKRFPRTRLYQAQSCPGVSGVYPIYSELSMSVLKNLAQPQGNDPLRFAKTRKRRKGYPIRSIGFFLDDPIFNSASINRHLGRLRAPQSAVIDVRSRTPNFDFPFDDEAALAKSPVELAHKKITLVGTFDLGTDFTHDGNLVMSAKNFGKYYPLRNRSGDPLNIVDIGVVHVEDSADVNQVRNMLERILNDDVRILTRQQFRDAEVRFWDKSTPIGIVFTAGKIIGFVVGMIICYQVIYSDIADHMPEFATLKAMGYSVHYFLSLIIAEALLLAVFGFLPGAAISTWLYTVLAQRTGLLMLMTMESALFVLALTVAMCVLSGLLAVRKLLSADPANLF